MRTLRGAVNLAPTLLAILLAQPARAADNPFSDLPPIGRIRVAVVEPQVVGVSRSEAGDLSNDIARQITKHRDYELVSDNEIEDAISHQKGRGPCAADDTCLTGVARSVNADMVLSGSLKKTSSRYVLTLTLKSRGGNTPSGSTSQDMKQLKSLAMNVGLCLDELFKWKAAPPPSPPPVAVSHPEPPPAVIVVSKPALPPPAPKAPVGPTRRRVMVLDLQAVAIDGKIVAPLPEYIAKEIARHPEYDVASSDDVNRMMSLQATKQAAGCTEDEGCITEISRKLDADLVVNGSVGMVGQSYVLNLALMNPKDLKSTTRTVETVARVEDLPKSVGPALAKLFHWSGAQVAEFHLPKGKKMSFAVLDLKPTGISAAAAQNLTQVLSVEVKGVEGASVVSRDDIAAILQMEAVKQQAGCADDACMAELGGALGVDRLIAGDAGKLGDTFLVNLRLIDVRHGSVENRVTESFSGDDEQLLRAVRHAARSLLGLPETGKGRLAVTASQNAAEVFVDQEPVGKAPLPIDALGAGRHEVRVSQNGYFDWHGDVYVDQAETTSVWAQLKDRPQQWYQKWWVWTIVGAVVAGATTVAIVETRPAPTTATGTVLLP